MGHFLAFQPFFFFFRCVRVRVCWQQQETGQPSPESGLPPGEGSGTQAESRRGLSPSCGQGRGLPHSAGPLSQLPSPGGHVAFFPALLFTQMLGTGAQATHETARCPAGVLTKGRVWEEQPPGWGQPGPGRGAAGGVPAPALQAVQPPRPSRGRAELALVRSELPLVSSLLPKAGVSLAGEPQRAAFSQRTMPSPKGSSAPGAPVPTPRSSSLRDPLLHGQTLGCTLATLTPSDPTEQGSNSASRGRFEGGTPGGPCGSASCLAQEARA